MRHKNPLDLVSDLVREAHTVLKAHKLKKVWLKCKPTLTQTVQPPKSSYAVRSSFHSPSHPPLEVHLVVFKCPKQYLCWPVALCLLLTCELRVPEGRDHAAALLRNCRAVLTASVLGLID